LKLWAPYGTLNHLSMVYLLSNICTKNYWNPATTVEIIVGGLMVSFLRHSVDSQRYSVDSQTERIEKCGK